MVQYSCHTKGFIGNPKDNLDDFENSGIYSIKNVTSVRGIINIIF